MRTLIVVNLPATRAGAERACGRDSLPDLEKLCRAFSRDGWATSLRVVKPNPTPRLARAVASISSRLPGTDGAVIDPGNDTTAAVDVSVALTVSEMAADEDVYRVVVVSGTGGTVPLIKLCAPLFEEHSVELVVASFDASLSSDLEALADTTPFQLVKLDDMDVIYDRPDREVAPC